MAPSIMAALHVMSSVTSLSHAEKKRSNSPEGLEGRGDIVLLSHFAVVIAVLTGVEGAIFELQKPFPTGDAQKRGGDIGALLVVDFVGEAITSYFLCNITDKFIKDRSF
jgi:hypothetical protein